MNADDLERARRVAYDYIDPEYAGKEIEQHIQNAPTSKKREFWELVSKFATERFNGGIA